MSKKSRKNNKIDLPAPNTQRWVKSRKLAVLNAIDRGALTEQEACKTYNLSEEELTSWRRLSKNHGPEALRTTHLKRYRNIDLRDQSFHIPEAPHGHE